MQASRAWHRGAMHCHFGDMCQCVEAEPGYSRSACEKTSDAPLYFKTTKKNCTSAVDMSGMSVAVATMLTYNKSQIKRSKVQRSFRKVAYDRVSRHPSEEGSFAADTAIEDDPMQCHHISALLAWGRLASWLAFAADAGPPAQKVPNSTSKFACGADAGPPAQKTPNSTSSLWRPSSAWKR